MTRILNRRGLVLGLVLALAASGVASFAAITDTLIHTAQVRVATVDLVAVDGGTDKQTLTSSVILLGGATLEQYNKPIEIKNNSNLQVRYSMASTIANEVGSLSTKVDAGVFLVSSLANCPASGDPIGYTVIVATGGTVNLTDAKFGSAVTGQQTGDRLLAAGASEILCIQFLRQSTATVAVTDAADLVMTYSAEAVTS